MDPKHTTEKEALPPRATLTGATLAAWRERMGFSQRAASEAIGCSRGAWAKWETGEHAVPLYIGLALDAVACGLNRYSPQDHVS